MMNFYTQEEFESQMVELMVDGVSRLQAYRTVCERERQDAQEYERWLDAQILDQEIHAQFG